MSQKAKNLPPYNAYACCPKCGWRSVSMHYCGPGNIPGRIGREGYHAWNTCQDEIGVEHFHRCCDRCGYIWLEAIPFEKSCSNCRHYPQRPGKEEAEACADCPVYEEDEEGEEITRLTAWEPVEEEGESLCQP